MTGMTGCGNNKNVASGSNTAMVHNSQPSDNNAKAETQSASETKADMDTQALQETDTNSKHLMIQNILLMSRYLMIVIIKTGVTAKIMMSGMIWMKELMRIRMKLQVIQWTTG